MAEISLDFHVLARVEICTGIYEQLRDLHRYIYADNLEKHLI
jgi:hypothetical protein